MEHQQKPASLLDHLSSFAVKHNYILLLGQPLSALSQAAWFIQAVHPAPSQPLILGQRIILISPTARTYFGRLKSIVSLEKSYLTISVSPESSAYGPFLPDSCHIYFPASFIVLPQMRRLQYTIFASHLSDAIHDRYSAFILPWSTCVEKMLCPNGSR